MAESATGAQSKEAKKKILTSVEYARICRFINEFDGGLPMDCELEMVNRVFPEIEPLALICILQSEKIHKARNHHWRHDKQNKKLLKAFEDQGDLDGNNALLVRMACVERVNPVAMCRVILQDKYDLKQRSQVSRLLKQPHLINDSRLSANVQQCIYSDNQDGPITDLRRRIIGEEYELKLKRLATEAGLHFYDEQDLRRMGFDKTPDIKLILPFLYKGLVVNWIESKANFGDPRDHKWNIQQQLQSYCNRFGHGIIIYWFGYHEETPQLPDNNIGITVLSDFPEQEHIEKMQIPDAVNADTSAG